MRKICYSDTPVNSGLMFSRKKDERYDRSLIKEISIQPELLNLFWILFKTKTEELMVLESGQRMSCRAVSASHQSHRCRLHFRHLMGFFRPIFISHFRRKWNIYWSTVLVIYMCTLMEKDWIMVWTEMFMLYELQTPPSNIFCYKGQKLTVNTSRTIWRFHPRNILDSVQFKVYR